MAWDGAVGSAAKPESGGVALCDGQGGSRGRDPPHLPPIENFSFMVSSGFRCCLLPPYALRVRLSAHLAWASFCVYSDDMQRVQIEIQEGVVPPERLVYKYPHAQLEVGQSFCVPFTVASRRNVLNANVRARKRLGWVFTARRQGDEIRVWRIS